jgi:3-deoxy-D-manno-octulosonic-acid transferase
MLPLYTLSVLAYGLALRLASPFHAKARKWVRGRKGWKATLAKLAGEGGHIWVHCASLGEFEQGRPLIEAIRQRHPGRKLLLTFFSPSGYEVRKDYAHADVVCYLPLDTAANARQFLSIVKPSLAIFVKYELWVNLHLELARRKVPVVLVSAKMLAGSRFFKSTFKGLYKRVLQHMAHVFTQDEDTATLLKSFTGHDRITVAGDTRFDRVAQVADKFEPVPGIQEFVGENLCIVCGSTWPKDEKLLLSTFEKIKTSNIKWIIAPHEIHRQAIRRMCADNHEWMAAYSDREKQLQPWHKMLWIDNIGMLSRLYHYADFAYIGGGFDAGIHNILEAVVYGTPVVFGPNHSKFGEAQELLASGGARSVQDRPGLLQLLREWTEDPKWLEALREKNRQWALSRTGATGRILEVMEANQLLD